MGKPFRVCNISSIIFSFAFSSAFFLSISIAFACINPTVYNEKGTPINPLGGRGLTINGTKYSEMQIDFPISVKNKNDQGLTVTLRPYRGLRDYIDDASIYLQPGETLPLNLRVWVGGQSYVGTIQVYYTCDDGNPQYFSPIVNVYIIGQKLEPPPTSTCESHDIDGCYSGLKRDYYCSKGELKYNEVCVESCCQNFGGAESICSKDKKTCLTYDTLPPGTEGSIAFICKDSTCRSGNDLYLKFMFRYYGWNVEARPKEAWTEAEIESYDIIACSDQKKACNFDFNSLIYNQHTNERKPFLEIPNAKSISGAATFGYITSKKAGAEESEPFVNSVDYITSGYSGSVQTVTGAEDYIVIKDSSINSVVKDLADAGNDEGSVMFKVKEAVDHGRYAFIGWLYDSTSLTADGSTLLSRTLKWLKLGDAAFGGQNFDPAIKGDIAFVCKKDCGEDNEIAMIEYLRENSYSVVAKEREGWTLAELISESNGYDLIVCSDSKTCDIDYGSAVYIAHKNYGKTFLEIPSKGGINAAEAFGYVHSRPSKKSGYAIVPQGTATIFSGFSGYMEVLKKKSSIYGANKKDLNPAVNLAIIPGSETSAMFVSNAAGSKGRYAYVGWMSDVTELTENGEKLLLRTIEWLICGDGCLQSFSSVFGDMSLTFDVSSPEEQTYDTKKIYISISTSQRVKEILYSINGGKEKRLCKDCNSVVKRLRAFEGENELKIKIVDYTGTTHEELIKFFVNLD